MSERSEKAIVGDPGDGAEQAERHILADHGSHLEDTLVVHREAVDTCGENALNGGGNLNGVDALCQFEPALVSSQCLCLDESPDGLLEEEWISPLHEEL